MVDLFELFERDGSKRNTGERRKGFRGLLDRVMNVVDGDGEEDDDDSRERRKQDPNTQPQDRARQEKRRQERESFFDDD